MSDRPDYSGMTVNERLVNADLMDAFDVATRSGERDAMIRLLMAVDLAEPDQTADALLRDPARYGY